MSDHVIVIGGGVIGAMTAWYLVQSGRQVTIVERDEFGAGCSHGNCGYVSPSHVLPLTRPGQIRSSVREMLKPNSTFAIRPRASKASLKWFWKFARRCNSRDMLESADGRHPLLQSSKRLYQQLVDEQGLDCEWKELGILFVFDTVETFEAYRATEKLIRERFGVQATPYDRGQLVELEPALKAGLGGAWHYEGDCHLRPDKLMTGMRKLLEQRGVRLVEHTEVNRFESEDGLARAIQCGDSTLKADQFVVAMGAWTPFLNDHLGVRIPIEPGKGYSITMPRPARTPRYPIVFEDAHVAITPMDSGYRIGSMMEFVGYDDSIPPRRLERLKETAARYLHDPYCEPIEESWFGWRPMTWDGKPVIDRSRAFENVWVAAGHNMLGISMGPATGKLVSELVGGQRPHVDPTHYSLSRFG